MSINFTRTYTVTSTIETQPGNYGRIADVGGSTYNYKQCENIPVDNRSLYIGSWNGNNRGWVEWDISNLLSTDTVDVLKVLYSCSAAADTKVNDYKNYNLEPNSLSNDGQGGGGTDYETFWNEVADGVEYTTENCVSGNNQIWTLGLTSGATACADMTACLSSGTAWFAIGIQLDSEWSGLANIKSEWSGAAPVPSLYVELSRDSTVTMNAPISISRSYTRKIQRHTFRTGNYAIQDVGKRIKTVTITGKEYNSSAEANISDLDLFMGSGDYVTLTGFDDDNLNTDWYITSFTWRKNPGYINRYDYNMTLEEA